MPACPHCGFDTGEGAATCPLCGSRTGSSAAGVTAPGAGSDRGVAGPAAGWEDPRGTFPSNLVATWRASLFEPAAFFRGLPYGAPLARPVLYYLIVSVTSAFFVLLWGSVSDSIFPSMALGSSEPVGPLLQFFFEPFGALIALGVGTLVLHALALVLAAEPRGIRATARVFCYAWGPSVFTIVPVLGWIVGFVWSVVLLVVGVREAHRTTGGRAAVIVVTPILVLLVAVLLLIALLVALGLMAGGVLDW